MKNSKGEYDSLPSAVIHLLPTPTARDWKSGASNLHGQNSRPLSEVALLFKTPTAQLGSNGGAQHPNKRKAGGHGPTLDDEVCFLLPAPEDDDLVQDWAEYEPAIQRQEFVTGRQAPIPTELGPKGGRRLTARFAEWLMGLPDGWVTDVPDLVSPKRDPRSKQLKAIGNGVVPQQAYTAFSHLLSQVALMKEVSIEATDLGH
ncbi:hypothetical protein ACIPJG_32225 [Streptomyces halstedii]|uniref:hypothetical protein n=1 Tax=Streptomyces halstedii TaxID=1944 RepID=UPI0038278D43